MDLFQSQIAVETLDHAVAFAGGFFQAFAIQDLHTATEILDEACIFESSGGEADAGASGAEHLRQKLVRQG